MGKYTVWFLKGRILFTFKNLSGNPRSRERWQVFISNSDLFLRLCIIRIIWDAYKNDTGPNPTASDVCFNWGSGISVSTDTSKRF